MATHLKTTGVEIGGEPVTAAAWANVDCSSGSPVNRNSHGISSIGDNGVGISRFNLATASSDIYPVCQVTSSQVVSLLSSMATGYCQIEVRNTSNAGADTDKVHVVIFYN